MNVHPRRISHKGRSEPRPRTNLFFPSGSHTPALPGLPGNGLAAPATHEHPGSGDMPAMVFSLARDGGWGGLPLGGRLGRSCHAAGFSGASQFSRAPWRLVPSRPLRSVSPVYLGAGNFAQGPEHEIREEIDHGTRAIRSGRRGDFS